MIKQNENGAKGVWAMSIAALQDEYDEAFEFIMENAAERNCSLEASVIYEELFVNVMRYAYGDDSGPIMVSVIVNDDNLEMVFTDSGSFFNPTEYYTSRDMSRIGGHGIELVRAYAKSFNYERVFGLNITRVVI